MHEFSNPLPVILTAKSLPKGVTQSQSMKGLAIMLREIAHCNDQFLVVLNETGEMIWVPQNELRMQESWSDNRRHIKLDPST